MLRKIYISLFFVGVFFIPFNSYQGVSFLGEFSRESSFLFFFSGIILYCLDCLFKGRFLIPIKRGSYSVFLSFIFWCLVCTLINIPEVYSSYFKQTSGINRFFRQYIVLLLLGVFLTSYFYSVFRNFSTIVIFHKIRKVFFISFAFLCVYSFFEVLIVIFDRSEFIPLIKIYDYFPFTNVKLDFNLKRISSVTFEPPFLAIYLITIAGWMFSYIITSKSIFKYIPTVVVIGMTFFSGSRTALVVVLIQFLTFLCILFNTRKYRKYIPYFVSLLMLSAIGLIIFTKGQVIYSVKDKIESLNFSKNLKNNVSNQSRFGMQYANFQVFLENPMLGVGYGQQAFHNSDHYPAWATRNNYEFKLYYLNEKRKSFPPGYNLYIRLLAETGIFGLLIYILFIVLIFLKLLTLNRFISDKTKFGSIILIVSFIGFVINWLQVDTFRIFGFWLCLGLLFKIQNENNLKITE